MARPAAGDVALSSSSTAKKVFLWLLAFRIFNTLLMNSFFQPDEYFQSLEPAWQMAFGEDSGAWITWEWKKQIRSSLHPAFFAGVYIVADKVARWLPWLYLIRPEILILTPRIVQAVFAAAGDWCTWQLAVKLFGPDTDVSWCALVFTVVNPWQWYVAVRTFSNSLETVLTIAALRYWPWSLLEKPEDRKGKPGVPLSDSRTHNELRFSLVLAAFAVILRPTNIVIWLTIAFLTIRRSPTLDVNGIVTLAREAVMCGCFVLTVSLCTDRLYYGHWTLPTYNFFYFNLSQGLAEFYGKMAWHYYISQGIPLLSISSLPFVLAGWIKPATSPNNQLANNVLKILSRVVTVAILSLSVISHKEFRFIYPLLPMLNVLAAPYAARTFALTVPPATSSGDLSSAAPTARPRIYVVRRSLLAFGMMLNIIAASYLTFFNHPAPISVTRFLRNAYVETYPQARRDLDFQPPASDELFALFLIPCHSTPWRSHLVHPGLRARALTCEPPLGTLPGSDERRDYRDEADRFYDSPVAFLGSEMWPMEGQDTKMGNKTVIKSAPIPRYVIGYQGIANGINMYVDRAKRSGGTAFKMDPVWAGWNGVFHEDWRQRGDLMVWKTRPLDD